MSRSQGERTELSELVTVRDWLRFGVSRFNQAGLVFGHGTASALDEAAFLLLHTLSLPIEEIDPWLDARLTMRERGAVFDIFEKRVTSRVPAPYLVGEAWIGPFRFQVDERVIIPRSFIGELLCDGFDNVVDDPRKIGRVLDLCTGSGCLAIIAANLFPSAQVDAIDLSNDALEVAKLNVENYDLESRISLLRSDLFDGLSGRTYDLIIANPPYVTDGAVAAFPPEYVAEPKMAHAGGTDGLDLVVRVLNDARTHLSPDGTIVVEVGEAGPALEEAFPDLDVFWLDTENSEGEVFSATSAALEKGLG